MLVAALVAGGVGGGIGYWAGRAQRRLAPARRRSASSDRGGDVKRDPGTVAGVAAKALPSTVTIEAEGSSGEGGTGTGFVFDTQGHILTNNHVVADAVDGGKLTATFPNGKKYDAEVVGHAQGYDVAVIKLKNAPSDLKPLAARQLRQGRRRRLDDRDRRALRPVQHGDHGHHQRQEPPGGLQRRQPAAARPRT